MGAGAAGMALGGFVAQRFSRRLVLLAPELVLVPAIALLPSLGYAAHAPGGRGSRGSRWRPTSAW